MSGMGSENLFSAAASMADELDSLYRDNRSGRMDLLDFMDANEWFGIAYFMKGNAPMMETGELSKLGGALTLWLSAYKKPGRDKIAIMLRHFSDIYPVTCQLYRKFIVKNHLEDEPTAWKLLDYLLSEIDRDIIAYDEADCEELIKRMDSGATLAAAKLFTEFLRTATHDGIPLTQWAYSWGHRDNLELRNEAYPIADFSVIAYCVFNEDMWERQNLIEKAVHSKVYADLWLYTALHFICALRIGDMERLPAPALPYDGNTVLAKITEGSFTRQESSALVEELTIRLKLKPLKPSKTSSHERMPELKVFVPESLKEPLGLIMAIALARHPEIRAGDGFVKPSVNLCNIRNFFGGHFADALGNRRFSSRRCNKSYLQGIDSAVSNDNTSGKPKGYMLAALARSHKSGIGTLSKTTDIYLKDANFSGYTPEFIIRQMFERGVFSFIPAVLLEMYAGAEYKALPIGGQTELICGLGLEAHRIEWMADTIDRALIKSRKAVHNVLKDLAKIKENVFGMLQNIASGNAPGRQGECLCLMTAAGLPCPFADRDGCVGCGYEIYTKTAMHTLMKEYARLTSLKNRVDKSETWRYKGILEQAILPAVSEMLAAAKLLYPDADTTALLDIVEEGITYADCDARGNGRQLWALDDSTGN